MLDHVKANFMTEKKDRIKAYIYGYYSHVISDCVFHPFIYRYSGDHGLVHSQESISDHKAYIESADRKWIGCPFG